MPIELSTSTWIPLYSSLTAYIQTSINTWIATAAVFTTSSSAQTLAISVRTPTTAEPAICSL